MPTIVIPTALRAYTDNQTSVKVEASTVGEAIQQLAERFPKLKPHLFNEQGRLRSFVNLYLGDEDVRHLQGLDTPLNEGDELVIVPSVAGGTATHVPTPGRHAPPGQSESPALSDWRHLIDDTRLQSVSLSQEEVLRYSRHLIMPEVTMEGQKRLKAARVLLVGAGGLGSPVAMYLAAAGVGTIGLVDFDNVDYTNLQRQILHFTSDVGRPKLQSAIEKIQAINPHVHVIPFETRLTSENALDILRDFDVIVDGTDNFPTRYLVNDACVLLGKPNVYGSIFRFEGQASVFWATHGPCYRCLYPEPPPPGLVPSCAEGGVLGILPGLIGLVQATETIKLILGKGEPLIGRLLLLDALAMRWRELKLRKDPNCPVCGENPTIRELIDYMEFCGLRGEEAPITTDELPSITPRELKERLERGEPLVILDVREPFELEISRLPNALHIPMGQVAERVHELNPADEIVVMCRSGGRSAQITRLLQAMGFRRVKNLAGGINAYAQEVDPSLPVY
ncbi:putative adenylyltransferase/sulfurtransferase MoeZ [bacterium HR15]|nr:putative adenylyltransferase/sulfurtransferase MoeZ [bacterium HR15]